MKNYNIPKKKWIYLFIELIVVITGITFLITTGFSKSIESDGGWMLTARISGDFNFGEMSSREEVYNYLKSFFNTDAKLKEGEYSEGAYEIISIYTDEPILISAEDFTEAVNEKYEGLLSDDWTRVHNLTPAYTLKHLPAAAIIFSVSVVLAFIGLWIAMDLKCSILTVAGMVINAFAVLAVITLLRIPVSSVVFTAVGTGVVSGFIISIFILNRLNDASSTSLRRTGVSVDEIVEDTINSSARSACIFSIFITLIIVCFVIAGVIFSANISWYTYSVMLFIALLIPQYYSIFILPGFYTE